MVGLRRDDVGPLLGLGALVVFLFAEVVLGGRVFFERDVTLIWHAQADALARVLQAGSWPTWNPYHSFGVPLLANPNVQVFYPLTWLSLVLRPETYYSVYVVLHLLVSAVGLYVLARRLGLSRPAAFLAAGAWVFSGPGLSLVQLWSHFAGAALMPWALVAADVAFASGRPVHAAAWGVAMAAQVLAGAPEMLVAGLLLSVGIALRHLVQGGPRRARPALRAGAVALLAVGVALALSAAQWVPTVATAWQTPRLAPPEAVRTQWSVHPARTLEIALPLRMPQLPLPDSIRGSLFDSGEVLLRSLYGGLGAALLVLCALAARQRRAWCLFAVFVSATLVALGRHAPVYGVVVGVLPVLRAFRYPEKAMVVAALAFALLAGVGLDACRRGAFGRRRILAFALPGGLLVLAAGVAALVGLGVLPAGPVGGGGGPALSAVLAPAGPRLAVAAVFGCLALAVQVRFAKWGAGGRSAVALGLLAVLDLMAAHADLNPTAPGEMFRLRPLALDALRVDDHSRLYVFDYALPGRSERYLGHAGGFSLAEGPPLAWRGMAAARTYPHPFTLASFGLEGSFVADTILLYPPHLDTLTRALFESEETAAELRLLRAGAVGRVVALHGRGFEDLVPLATRPSLFREPMRLFQVPDPVPRSYLVGTVRVASDEEALRFLRDPARDLRAEVVASGGAPREGPASFAGSSTIALLRPDRVRLQVEANAPATVVLVDTFDPGWTVTVNGRPAEPRRVNVSFRGVDVPAGLHEVEWLYRPPAVVVGGLVSGTSVLAAAAFFLLRLRRR